MTASGCLLLAAGAGVLLGGCSPGGESATEPFGGLEVLARAQVFDLTHALSSTAPYWPSPDGNPFHYRVLAAHPSGATAMGAYSTPEHFGTHLDAPVHSADGQRSVDQLTPADLIGPAVVIGLEQACNDNPDYRLQPEDLIHWEQQHGRIAERAIVLMRTGWSERWPDQQRYANEDADGHMHFPGFSAEAARFLVGQRHILGIGIDTFSVDAAAAEGFPVHGIVNGAGKFHLENLAALERLPAAGAWLVVAPVKIAGGSGSQARVFALLPPQAVAVH